jgi:hypothetical protein
MISKKMKTLQGKPHINVVDMERELLQALKIFSNYGRGLHILMWGLCKHV